MAAEEGVSFPWKMSKLFAPKQPRPRESLPAPPSGMEWELHESTNEWKLVKSNVATAENTAATTTEGRPPMIPVTPDRDSMSPRRSPVSSHPGVVDRLPSRSGGGSEREDDWEWLSERNSHTEGSNNGQDPVLVPRSCGSVRSIGSVEDGAGTLSSHLTPQSVPFKIQRTASSSTIDSQDAAIGPLGKGVLGVDYVEHVILPTDTLQGICLAYNISSTKLRQANHFSGNSLLLAPKKLVIPLSKKALRAGYIRVQDTDAKEYKLHAFLAEFSDLNLTEAKAYLELADWNLKDAIKSAKDDREWEKEIDHQSSHKSGEIRIAVNMREGVPVGFATKGAGIVPTQPKETAQKEPAATTTRNIQTTPNMNVQDVFEAMSQHNNFGVEMKALGDKKL